MVESSTVYGRVAGSIPVGPAFTPVAQWTERKFAELEVAGSIPARGARHSGMRQLGVVAALSAPRWAGSNPACPTII